MTDIYTPPSESEDNELQEQEDNNKLTPDEKLEALEKKLQIQRDEWGNKLIALVKRVKQVDQLTDAQVDMLSYRQMIVELLTKARIRVRKSQSTYERQFKTRFISYFNYDYKISDKNKVDMVNADLYFYRRSIGLLESQIDFFKECISTLDKMGFAIKNRVNFEEI